MTTHMHCETLITAGYNTIGPAVRLLQRPLITIIMFEHMASCSQVLENEHFLVTVMHNTAGAENFKRRLQLLYKRCCAGKGFAGGLRCQELARKAQRLPVDHLSSRGTHILLPGGADTHQDEREGLGPASLVAADGCLQLAVKASHHTIGCRVVRCGMYVSGSGRDVRVPEQEGLELPPLVCGDSQQHPEATNPCLEECSGHRGCHSLVVVNGQ